MAAKKKKHKFILQLPPAELLKRAAEQLQRGQYDDALQSLQQAASQLKPRATPDGKKVSTPPHLLVAQAELPGLQARAYAARARNAGTLAQKLNDLTQATQAAPGEPRYWIARGALQMLNNDALAALGDFGKATASSPDTPLVNRARRFGQFAAQGTRTTTAALEYATQTHGRQPLFDGLAALAAGETERAQTQLNELPAFDHNPTRGEAALLATQFFYSGALHLQSARQRAALGDWHEAQRLIETHSLALPWRARLAAGLHELAAAVAATDLPLAIESWQAALKLDPNDKIAQQNLSAVGRQQALHAWHAGQHQQAANLWQEALTQQPQDEKLRQYLALACERLGRKEEAVTHWRELAKLWRRQAKQRAVEAGFKERLVQLEQHVIKLMLETGAPEHEIVSELETALNLDPDNTALRLQAADQLLELGRAQQALKHLEHLEKQQGASAELLIRKGQTLDMLGQFKLARQTLERALQLEPDNALAKRSLLLFLDQEVERAEERGDEKRAMEICRQQIALDPHYDEALAHLADLHLCDRELAPAKELLARIIAHNPQSAQKHVMAGDVYLTHGLKKEAETVFKKAVELEPSVTCFMNIGRVYWDCEEEKTALKYFDRAAADSSMETLIEIAVYLVEAGDEKNLKKYLDLAIKRDPQHPMPHLIKAVNMLGLAGSPLGPLAMLLGFDQKKFDKAVAELAEAERLMEGKAEFQRMLPEIRQMRQMFEQGPPGLGGLLGGRGGPLAGLAGLGGLGGPLGLPPFGFYEGPGFDEGFNDDFLFGAPARAKKNKSKKKR